MKEKLNAGVHIRSSASSQMNYSQQKRINDNTCSESKFQKKEGKMQVQSNKNGKDLNVSSNQNFWW